MSSNDERSVGLLGAALAEMATPAWSLLLADPDTLQTPPSLRFIVLRGVAGSSAVEILVVGGATLAWLVAAAEETALPGVFFDGGCASSACVVDLGIVHPVSADPASVFDGLREALGTTLVVEAP